MEKNVLFFLSFCLLVLLSCKEKEDRQLLDSIEQAWQLCETSLKDAQARAETLRDSVRLSSEYAKQKYDLLSIRLRPNSIRMGWDVVPCSHT